MSGKSAQIIADGKVVTVDFTLTNDDGEVLDTTAGDVPLAYLHGADNVVSGLERQLTGKSAGDKLSVDVSPEDGYGQKEGPGPQPVGRDAFPEDVEIEPGLQFEAEDDNGEMMPLWVVSIQGDEVFVDSNHPLAGTNLHFDIKILEVRDATAEEKEHGHPHGPDGHAQH